ncbi:hypothetical protein BpHYR1_021624 [Brachionus plicatilis]|uniref:Uncharacterized protein n=1 Tax=Brachionus plicatilis TaxID=10195 RepID=A0A3M7PIK8_BRAPC|nr:hypothetical protein BpHYR1_021624 [Brachionus plicatilis]
MTCPQHLKNKNISISRRTASNSKTFIYAKFKRNKIDNYNSFSKFLTAQFVSRSISRKFFNIELNFE